MGLQNFITDQGFEVADAGAILSASGAPIGTSGPTDVASIGAIYMDTGAGGALYKKQASTSSASDWERVVDETIYTALGISFADVDFGTFTGDIISDNGSAKTALQELETELIDTRQNTDDLITLSGEAENATDHGTFTGATITDNSDTHSALQDLETALEAIQGGAGGTDVIPAATPTEISACSVDTCNGVEWECTVFETASATTKEFFKVTVLHDGTGGSDATTFDYAVHSKLKLADIAGLSFTPKLTGVGVGQTISLEISATAGITVETRRTDIP